MVDWTKQHERVQEVSGGNRAKDGDIINLEFIDHIEEREIPFNNPEDGKTIQILRFVYVMQDNSEIVVPVSLHGKITKLKKEYGERLRQVKVTVEGKKLNTRYDALPLL